MGLIVYVLVVEENSLMSRVGGRTETGGKGRLLESRIESRRGLCLG